MYKIVLTWGTRYRVVCNPLWFAMSNLHRYFEIKTKRKLDIDGNETVTKNKETTIMIKKWRMKFKDIDKIKVAIS